MRAKVRADRELTATATLEQIRRGSQFDVRALFDKDGNYKPIHELTEAEAAMIAGFEVLKRNVTAGDGKVERVLKVRLVDRARYVEMAAKHHGLLLERIQVEDEDGRIQKLLEGRKRVAAAKRARAERG